MNGLIARRIRKGGKLMGGTDGLVLTTTGHQERRTPQHAVGVVSR